MGNKHYFLRFAETTARYTGTAGVFICACGIVLLWAATGPLFHYSDTWQLVINTGTTVITFLMVFLIQNTQNRDARAVQLKLDELLRATQGAHLGLIDLQDMDDEALKAVEDEYLRLAQEAHQRLKNGGDDCDTPEVTLS